MEKFHSFHMFWILLRIDFPYLLGRVARQVLPYEHGLASYSTVHGTGGPGGDRAE